MNYKIELQKLNLGHSKQDFKINGNFFEEFNYSDIKNADITIKTDIEAKSTSVSLEFHIEGSLEVECDVCLDNFKLKIESTKNLFLRISDRNEGVEEQLEDENKITISKTKEFIDLEKHFFDFIVLSLPMKKTHPLNEDENRTCNPEFLLKLEEFEPNTNNIKDPRWDKLKQLFN
jgi:DUF177 domain-containing protein